MMWHPIETAPKDGTSILVYGEWAGEINGIDSNKGCYVAIYTSRSDYEGFSWSVTGSDGYASWVRASHWMPLPPDPSSREEGLNVLFEEGQRFDAEVQKDAVKELVEALKRIERWYGEFPETGKYWENEPTRPMSYGSCYGSDGERDFMRRLARDALISARESGLLGTE